MIRKIRIQRFRSIDDITIDCERLTGLVGPNDAGKSNIVRALNLFFNEETDLGDPFDFEKDYNRFSKVGQNKAKEVVITLTFDLPGNFQKTGMPKLARWRKVWRKEGERTDLEQQKYSTGKKFGGYSKIPSHLRTHFLEYVPAIKDQRFFARLLGDIYDKLVGSMSRTSAQQLVSSNLTNQLKPLTNDLRKVFGEPFTIDLPSDLRPIFEELDIKNVHGIPLEQRGDGIKIRHIPELLKFITDKTSQTHTGLGRLNSSHLWVFEEPENNLEIGRAFDMVKRLEEILLNDDSLQIFITTHSPVFYNLGNAISNGVVKRQFVTQVSSLADGDNPDESEKKEYETVVRLIDDDELDDEMGILPLLAEKTEEVKRQLDDVRERANQAERQILSMRQSGVDFSERTIFVEGKSDELVYQRARDLFLAHESDLKIRAPQNGSAQAAVNYLHAWKLHQQHLKGERTKAAALLDDDEAAKTASGMLPSNLGANIKVFNVSPKGTTLGLYHRNYHPTKDLESLYSDAFWLKAKDEGWLGAIDGEKDFGSLPPEIKKAIKTGEDIDRWAGLSEIERVRLEYQFTKEGKMAAAKYISNCHNDEAIEILKNVESNLKAVVDWLNVSSTQAEMNVT